MMPRPCNNHGRPREVEISREELARLPEYSCSLPTGTTVGRRWRRNAGAYRSPPMPEDCHEHKVAEYVECSCLPDGRIGIAWAWAIDPMTREPHRGKLR